MVELFTIENLFTLIILTALETVLGFNNLLYISIQAKRVEPSRQQYVRRLGMILAIGLRIILLFVILQLIASFHTHLRLRDNHAEGDHQWPQPDLMAGGGFLFTRR